MRTFRLVFLLAPALLLSGLARADEVHLKGGAVFSGRIVEQTETTVSIDLGDGVVGVPRERVDRIVKARSPLDDHDERASRLKPEDVGGWKDLGRWASQQGLAAQSRRAYENALAYAPDDAEARQALGFVLVEGRWLTEEESYRAQGYVKFEGEWMTPDEARMVQAAAAAEQARYDAEKRADQAEIAAQEARSRADEAEQRAREAEQSSRSNDPLYWGGWGYGMTYWPSYSVTHWPAYRPVQRPVQRPARVPR